MNKEELQKLIDDDVAVTSKQLRDIVREELDLTHVNTSKVDDMIALFYNYKSQIPGTITNWDTSNVTHMNSMFCNASSFNQPLDWDTSSVRDMSGMFYKASGFNQPLSWDTSSVRDMSEMFCFATSFNQPLNFDTSNVETMACMLFSARDFEQPFIFDMSSVAEVKGLFSSDSKMKYKQTLEVTIK